MCATPAEGSSLATSSRAVCSFVHEPMQGCWAGLQRASIIGIRNRRVINEIRGSSCGLML